MKVNVYGEHVNAETAPFTVTRTSMGVRYAGVVIPLHGEHNAVTFWARLTPAEVDTLGLVLHQASHLLAEVADAERSSETYVEATA